MDKLKSVLVAVAGLIGIFVVGALIFEGTAYVVAAILPYLATAVTYVLPVFGMVLFPLTAFKLTRKFAIVAIFGCTYIFGAFLWCFGFIVAYSYWGFTGIIIGLVLGGVGVVPVAFVAAIWHGAWNIVFNLVIGSVLVIGGRMFVIYKAEQIDQEELEE